MKTHLFHRFLLILFCCGIFGCQNESEKGKDKDQTDTAETKMDTAEAKKAKESAKPSMMLPSPLQMATIFQKSGLSYISGLTNSPEKVTNYISRPKRLMNLGVYSADLSYCALNGQSQKAGKYLKSVRELAQKVGMSGIFKSENLIKRFEENLDNRDSVIKIMGEIQANIDGYLSKNQQQNKSPVIFTGAWIEGMYIGMKAIEDNGNEDLTERLVEQLTILKNLINILEAQPDKSESLIKVVDGLKDLNKMFQDFVAKKKEERSSDGDIEVNYEDLEGMANKIKSLRQLIVSS